MARASDASEPRPYHHGDLRNALLETAITMVDQEGEQAVSLRELAKRVGVSSNAPYRHFANKEELLASVAQAGFAELSERFRNHMTVPASARLQALGQSYYDFALERPGLFRLMFSARAGKFVPYPELVQATDEAFHMLASTVAELLGEDLLSEAVGNAAVSIWAMVHGYAMLVLDGALDPFPQAPDDPSACMVSLYRLFESALGIPRPPTA